jgi:membrane-associated phospholipid phosphatase
MSRRRWVRAVALAHVCLTGLAVLATGNHFVLDVVAGLLVLAVAVALADALARRGLPRPARGRRGRPSRKPVTGEA